MVGLDARLRLAIQRVGVDLCRCPVVSDDGGGKQTEARDDCEHDGPVDVVWKVAHRDSLSGVGYDADGPIFAIALSTGRETKSLKMND
ncbi:MAG: hypothetical protein ACREO4_03000 [Lysobacter sp.]